jgi:hypothetical protein
MVFTAACFVVRRQLLFQLADGPDTNDARQQEATELISFADENIGDVCR